MQEKAILLYVQSMQIANMVSMMFSGNKSAKPEPLEAYYPELFRDFKKDMDPETELLKYRAEMEAFASAHNRRWKAMHTEGGEEDGSGHNISETESFD